MPRVQLGFDQGLVEALSKRRCTKSTSCPRPGRRGPGGGTSSTYSTTMATGTRRSSTTSGPSAESWGSRYGRGPQTRGGEAERRPDGPASDLVSGFSQQGDGASFEGTWEYAAGCCRRIREHAPVDERLHETPTRWPPHRVRTSTSWAPPSRTRGATATSTACRSRSTGTATRAGIRPKGRPRPSRPGALAVPPDARLAPTLEHLANLYMEKHAPVKKRPWKEDRRVMNNELFPTWHTLRATDIRRRNIRTLIEKIAERPAPSMANRTPALIHTMFQFRHRSRGRRVQPVRANRASGQGARPRSHPDRRGDPPVLVGAGWRAAHLAATFRLRLITA